LNHILETVFFSFELPEAGIDPEKIIGRRKFYYKLIIELCYDDLSSLFKKLASTLKRLQRV